jgi:hypothetical protein
VFFENMSCEVCEAQLGFIADEMTMGSFEPAGRGLRRLSETPSARLRRCGNHDGPSRCNWMMSTTSRQPLCPSCRTTRVLPSLDKPDNRAYWCRIETAKRQLVYSVRSWKLPFPSKSEDPRHGVAFDFLEQLDRSQAVLTGHSNGVITLNVAEADDAHREQMRAQMHAKDTTPHRWPTGRGSSSALMRALTPGKTGRSAERTTCTCRTGWRPPRPGA